MARGSGHLPSRNVVYFECRQILARLCTLMFAKVDTVTDFMSLIKACDIPDECCKFGFDETKLAKQSLRLCILRSNHLQ